MQGAGVEDLVKQQDYGADAMAQPPAAATEG